MSETPGGTSEETDERRARFAVPRTFQALVAFPMFRQLWLAMLFTSLAQWTAQVTFGWLALELTDSARFVGLVSFASGLPFLVVAIPAGVYIDRLDRRTILIVTQAAAVALGILMALDVLAGTVEPWHLLVAAFLNGSFLSILNPTMQSVIPTLVGREGVTNAVGLMSAGQNGTRIVGPSLAGVIIGVSSTGFAFLLVAGMLMAALAFIVTVRVPARVSSVTSRGLRGAFSGIDIIWNRPDLRVLFVLACLPPILIFPYVQFLNIFARDILKIGAEGFGIISGAAGVGGIVGSLMMASRTFQKGDGMRQIRIILLYATGVVIVAFSTSLWITLPLLVLGGLLGGTYMSTNNALMQLRIDDDVRGRVMATYMMTFGLLPLGALPMGLIADVIGIQVTVASGAVLCAVLIAVIAVRSRALREI